MTICVIFTQAPGGKKAVATKNVRWKSRLARLIALHLFTHKMTLYSLVLNLNAASAMLKSSSWSMRRYEKEKLCPLADKNLDAKTIVTYYKARFQIEFIFRDAKQFTGLSDAQTGYDRHVSEQTEFILTVKVDF